MLNHGLEVYVHFYAKGFIIGLPLTTLLLYIVHATTPLLTINLKLLDLIQAGGLLGEGTLPTHVVSPSGNHIALVGASSRTARSVRPYMLSDAACHGSRALITATGWYTYNQPINTQSSNVPIVFNQTRNLPSIH